MVTFWVLPLHAGFGFEDNGIAEAAATSARHTCPSLAKPNTLAPAETVTALKISSLK